MSKTLRFTKVLLAIFALCLSAAAGGQNSVFAQGTEVTDVLKSTRL